MVKQLKERKREMEESVIYKFTLQVTDTQGISMPKNANILSVHSQRDKITLWANIRADDKVGGTRIFRIIGTGRNYSSRVPLKYIGTVLTVDDSSVWHVFEEV